MPAPAQQIHDWLATYDTPDTCVAHLLCDRHPADTVAITEIDPDLGSRDLTYGELARRSTDLANGMARLGVTRGDHVATLMGRGADLAITSLAVWRLGAVHVPLFTALAPSAVALRLTDPTVAVVICDDDQRFKLDPGPDMPAEAPWHVVTTTMAPLRDGDYTLTELADPSAPPVPPVAAGGAAPFILLYTSGTGGSPRGVEVPVRALAAFHAYHHYGLNVTDDDVYWNTADPGWAYGLYYGLVAPLLAGHRTLQLRAGFDPELTLDVLATFGVTNLAAAPTVYRTLRATVKTLPPEIALRCLSSAGEPLTPDVVDWAFDTFGVALREHYGQSELGMCAGQHHHPDVATDLRAASIGRSLPGWDMTVLDPVTDEEAPIGSFGRVAVDVANSPTMWFTGYHAMTTDAMAPFTPDGRWYLTGDTGSQDENGYLFFSARDNDVILMSGYRIGPADVESALLQHPAVEETVVYGVPDELRGQTVAASVVLGSDTAPTDELAEELKEMVRNRFAAHAYPRYVTFVTELPRTPSGKIRRSRLHFPVR